MDRNYIFNKYYNKYIYILNQDTQITITNIFLTHRRFTNRCSSVGHYVLGLLVGVARNNSGSDRIKGAFITWTNFTCCVIRVMFLSNDSKKKVFFRQVSFIPNLMFSSLLFSAVEHTVNSRQKK
jgi:hypothetical protein